MAEPSTHEDDQPVPEPPTPPPADVMAALPAVPESASVVRQRLRRWMCDLEWPADAREDIVMAVNEAVANVIEHAYPPAAPGQVRVYGWAVNRDDRQTAVVTVTDDGRWRPERRDRANRGRGLLLMDVLMAQLMIEPTDRGTSVIMVSPAAGR
jgi:serine/threonine-protein kinase RsbW